MTEILGHTVGVAIDVITLWAMVQVGNFHRYRILQSLLWKELLLFCMCTGYHTGHEIIVLRIEETEHKIWVAKLFKNKINEVLLKFDNTFINKIQPLLLYKNICITSWYFWFKLFIGNINSIITLWINIKELQKSCPQNTGTSQKDIKFS